MTTLVRFNVFGKLLVTIGVVLGVCCGEPPALAGGGPENVFLVVNSRSWASQTVANHFIALRKIPPGNVLYLDWSGSNDVISVDAFRKDILNPILAAVDARGLTRQIDYIIYSSDFPSRINYSGDLPRTEKFSFASINGMTFLAPLVIKKDTSYKTLATNHYMGQRHPDFGRGTAYGFRSSYGWDARGAHDDDGRHHYLSSMLAVTSGRGNSVPEAIAYLRRSATADGRRPKGTIYFVKNGDIRSTTRERSRHTKEPGFEIAVAALKKLGVAAEIVNGTVKSPLPVGKTDVCGAMIGARRFNWSTSRSTISPGAICEHFTSFGGDMRVTASQTPLSELLRYGAAGASGTVVEPFATQEKFPVPLLHVYYAQGCTLAEAFYQSVLGPYQLLIVGDPLCRPWARIPQVSVAGVKPGATIKGTIRLVPSASIAESKINHFELFVDGQLTSAIKPDGSIELDTTTLADGYHELRVVAVEARPIESQGRMILPVVVSNRGRTATLRASARRTVRWGDSLILTVAAPGAAGCEVYHNSRLLGVLDGAGGRLRVNPQDLGQGPISLRAVATYRGNPTRRVQSQPVRLTVEPSVPRPGRRLPGTTRLRPGLKLQAGASPTVPIQRTSKSKWLEEAGVRQEQDYTFGAWFEVSADGVYQFQVRHVGALRIEVDGAKVYDGAENQKWMQSYIPLSLGSGYHRLRVAGNSARRAPQVDLRFGNSGVDFVDGRRFKN